MSSSSSAKWPNSPSSEKREGKVKQDLTLSLSNKTKRTLPRVSFLELKNAAVGKKYELSLVFCGNALSRKLNRTYRDKDKPTNVLSFTISKTSGEIFINLAHLDGFSVENLFVHGLFHLKGMEHGATMERAEQALLKKFHGSNLRRRY
jgi:ssRNA-specific RNase YbeY (16S rRNA maturation enzyme)